MNDILSAIQDDINEYEALCRRYNEQVQTKLDAFGNQVADCYGDHSEKLKTRLREESLSKVDAPATSETPTAEDPEEEVPGEHVEFKVRLVIEHANKLKAIFPDMTPTTFIQVALTVLNWVHDEEIKGRVILSATPEGTDVTRLVPLSEIAKQQ